MVDAYTLGFAAFLLTSGAVADHVGARRVFLAGFTVFMLASLGCAAAPGILLLIGARAVQGLGAAMLVPSSLALLNQGSDSDSARAHAVGIWTSAGAAAIAFGPLVGGAFVDALGWRSIFFINLPLGAVGIWLTLQAVAARPGRDLAGRLDLAGLVLAAVALAALVAAVIEARPLGLRHPALLAPIATALLAGGLLIAVEARRGERAMLPLRFFTIRSFAAANLAGLAINLTMYGSLFVLSLYFQHVRGYSPLGTGLAFLPMASLIGIANVLAGKIVGRTGPRLPMTLGLVAAALGYALLARLDAHTPMLPLQVGLCLAAGGTGLAVPAVTTAVLASVERERGGIAAGVLNSIRQSGGAIGVALFGALAEGGGAQLVAGADSAFAGAAALCALAVAVAAIGVRPRHATHTGRAAEGLRR